MFIELTSKGPFWYCLLSTVFFLYKVILEDLSYQAILIDVRRLITIKV